jgi:hypothetical protein
MITLKKWLRIWLPTLHPQNYKALTQKYGECSKQVDTIVLEKHIISIFGTEDGDSMFLWTTGV